MISDNLDDGEDAAGNLQGLIDRYFNGFINGVTVEDINVACNTPPFCCYPGPLPDCTEHAFFISLTGPYATGEGHLSFRKALECLVQHMQGSCRDRTKFATLISDNWDASACYDWKDNIEQIRDDSTLTVYLISRRFRQLIKL